MTEIVSDVKVIPHNDADVFRVLSDLSKLEGVKDRIPADKFSDLSFDAGRASFRISPIGMVTFLVEERVPNKLVKFKSEALPFDVFVWIQLVSTSEKDTRLRLTLRANLNPFVKAVAEKPMHEAVDQISEALAQLPYDRL